MLGLEQMRRTGGKLSSLKENSSMVVIFRCACPGWAGSRACLAIILSDGCGLDSSAITQRNY